MEPMKPREDHLLKLDIIQDEVARKAKDFLAIAGQARAKFAGTGREDRRVLLETKVQDAADFLSHMMGCLREEYAMHGSFTPGVGARDDK